MSDLALDLDTVIARLEQIESLPYSSDLRALVLDRVLTCDLPRLREHRDRLDDETAPHRVAVRGGPSCG